MIEVAFFISTFLDVAEAEEKNGKGTTPKRHGICSHAFGHTVNNCMTVIFLEDGVLSVK
ncbi:MAG: hypothetical protein HFI78_05510 [Lachnospiraceae bacterium]|nr:hypothetical protein [Lachnospiraceae bacterium]